MNLFLLFTLLFIFVVVEGGGSGKRSLWIGGRKAKTEKKLSGFKIIQMRVEVRGFEFFFLDVPFPVAVIDQKRLTPRAYTHHLEIDCREMATMEAGGGRGGVNRAGLSNGDGDGDGDGNSNGNVKRTRAHTVLHD